MTRPDTPAAAVADVDAIVLTLGSDGGAHSSPEDVDHAGVRNILTAPDGRTPRIVPMTSIGVTSRSPACHHLLDGKRRSERLVRASGLPCTIVRPGWFGMNGPGEHRPVFLQGDTRRTGTPGRRRHRTPGDRTGSRGGPDLAAGDRTDLRTRRRERPRHGGPGPPVRGTGPGRSRRPGRSR
ncbi:NAD(P)H-binding protein [Streptomyces pimonensis]|uniref:NAD(P)H-binding protein n=1 Tax=Streptomyces pimonensis TaxID=2860288 RepID=A0ABV4J2X2_9ACTN